jgi:tetratricopeptide (TPR) repeat protein
MSNVSEASTPHLPVVDGQRSHGQGSDAQGSNGQGSSGQGSNGLGERLRSLRLSAGLTQTELAGDRFSKEYVSQIERGKTRPTPETTAWLAQRLGVDSSFLATGVATELLHRVEATLARAEALTEARRYAESLEVFERAREDVGATGSSELEVRCLSGAAWALAEEGQIREALELLQRARELSEGPEFDDVDRADVLFRLGVCRYKLASVASAVSLLDGALELADRSGLPCDLLRADILGWRSRCRRHQRDFEAAREDVERALELAQAMDDRRTIANVYYQASLVAERTGHWIASRNYALQAKALYQELDDERTVGRLLQNLGGLHLLLGKPHQAIDQLKAAFELAVESESKPDAAQALGNLATVYLHLGDFDAADDHARRGLELLEGREDFLHEVGQSHVVLGRALLERGRLAEAEESFRAADSAFERLGSVSYRAGAWVALGDLASRRGDDREAARLYRSAAEALQDIRF